MRFPPRAWVIVAALTGATAPIRSARAQSAPGSWLHWQAPPECRNTAEVERQIESLLGRDVDFTRVMTTRARLSWSESENWTLRLSVALPGGERTREIAARTCANAYDLVALTLALILEPTLAAGEADSEGAAPVYPVGDQAAEGDDASASDSPPPADDSPAPAGLDPDPAPPAAPPAPLGEPLDGTPRYEAPPVLSPFRTALSVGAGARIDLGTLPTPLYGGGLLASVRSGGWLLEVGAELSQSAADTLPTARYAVEYSNVYGLAQACRRFRAEGGTHFGTCLGGQLGSLSTREVGGEERQAQGPWAAATLGGELGFWAAGPVMTLARFQLAFPLIVHELVLAGGGVVHELPPVSAQFQLAATIDVTDWGER